MNVQCPFCQQAVIVESLTTVQCPHCAQAFSVEQPQVPQPVQPIPQAPLQQPPTKQFQSYQQQPKPKNNSTLIVLGIVGGAVLVLGAVLVVSLLLFLGNSDEGGGGGASNASFLSRMSQDSETASDEKMAKSFFQRSKSNADDLRNVKWSSQPLYVAIMKSTSGNAMTHTEATSKQDAMDKMKERDNRGHQYQVSKLERIGTVFTVEYEGMLYGSEKAAKERIEVKYAGYSYSSFSDPDGKTSFNFEKGPNKSVQSVETVMRGLDR